MKNSYLLITLLILLLTGACGGSSGVLTVRETWSRPVIAGENGAAYFVIENGTTADDTLLSVNSEIACATEVHMSMSDANGVMSMTLQESVSVPAGEQVDFKPGGLHVMLVDLKKDLNVGDMITLTLNFENAGELTVQVPVKEP
jgi:copper(I)-binding protein